MLIKLARLSGRRRALLLQAVVLLWAARLTLSLLPFRMWRAWLTRMMQPVSTSPMPSAAAWWRDAAWAVRTARRSVPNATCLVQAMGSSWLGARYDHASQVFIGVAPAPTSGAPRLEAHAWLESDGHVIIGGDADIRRFARLPQFPAQSNRVGMVLRFR